MDYQAVVDVVVSFMGVSAPIVIVRILKTVCLYLLLVSKYSLSVHYDILFFKQTQERSVPKPPGTVHRIIGHYVVSQSRP